MPCSACQLSAALHAAPFDCRVLLCGITASAALTRKKTASVYAEWFATHCGLRCPTMHNIVCLLSCLLSVFLLLLLSLLSLL